MVKLLKIHDYDAWIDLAKEVEHLFGPMVDSGEFKEGILACINNNNAFGIESGDGKLAGVMAIDRESNEILWLAVKSQYRGNKYGDILVKKAIEELANRGDVIVQTFAQGVIEGASARVIYERNGFVDLKPSGINPAGIETVIMIKKAE